MNVVGKELLVSKATRHKEREEFSAKLFSGQIQMRDYDLALPLREYQKTAVTLVLGNGGLLLADDLGLGKTSVGIAMLTDQRARPGLVVTQTHLTRQWTREFGRFAPGLRVHVLRTGKPYDVTKGPSGKPCRHRWVADDSAAGQARCRTCDASRDDAYHGRTSLMPDVIITSYSKLSGWAETLAGTVNGVVYDEAQELRSGNNKDTPAKYLAAQSISNRASFRLGLTGTPIYNYGGEIYSVLDCINPKALGEWPEFRDEWCGGAYGEDASKVGLKDPRAFGTYARSSGMMLRRTRADVGRELPAVSKVSHIVDADEDKLNEVSDKCAELAKAILRQGEKTRGAKMLASEELSNALRQATGIAKAPEVAAFVKMLLEGGEKKVVVWAWHRAVYDILLEALKDYNPQMYTGSETPLQKDRARANFVNGGSRVLIMSLRSGAGLDGLQEVCRTGVFAELDWSPGAMEQCGGRIHRDGQGDPVVLYHLIAESGSDPIVADVLGLKTNQVEALKNPEGDGDLERLQVDEGRIKKLAEYYLASKGVNVEQVKAEVVELEEEVA
jgi:SNF2 family DNA or RNA helicase